MLPVTGAASGAHASDCVRIVVSVATDTFRHASRTETSDQKATIRPSADIAPTVLLPGEPAEPGCADRGVVTPVVVS